MMIVIALAAWYSVVGMREQRAYFGVFLWPCGSMLAENMAFGGRHGGMACAFWRGWWRDARAHSAAAAARACARARWQAAA